MELDDILDDKEPAQKTPEAPAAPAAAPKAEAEPKEPKEPAQERPTSRRKEHQAKELIAQGRDPATGQFVSKEPKEEPAAEPKAAAATPPAPAPAPAAPSQPEYTEREKAFLRAVHEERTKRQELERRMSQPPAAPAEQPKKFWDDPEGALSKHEKEIRAVAMQTKIATAEMIARSKYQDYDRELAVFHELAKTTPALVQQLLAAQDPAEFAYRTGKVHRELREAGGLDQLRAKIESETRAKVEGELRAKEEARQKEISAQRAALPPTLSDARGGTQNRVSWGGPPSLDEVLKG